ncbi:MAG: bifunctional diguanylate cyclase/phosphodiesterase [Lachnospiraceae bacterium]|nr:bifunctional diguanylate cyclase/phosphodiesterase [Lachnospiraceae bacterium]
MLRNRSSRIPSVAGWFKKLKMDRALAQVIAVCALLLIACIFLSGFHVHRIYTTFEEASYDYVFDRSELTSKYFADNFERRGALVVAEAQGLAQSDTIDKDSICNCLKVLEETGEFTCARYISNRGIKYHSNGSINSTIMTQYNDRIDPLVPVSVYVNFDPERYDDEICFGSAVLKNGLIQGYVIGIAKASLMFEANVPGSKSMVNERYLTDEYGNIVAYIVNGVTFNGKDSNTKKGKNIFDKEYLGHDCIDEYAVTELKEEVLNEVNQDKMMNRTIMLDGKKAYVLYKQLSGNSRWNLFYVVKSEDVRKEIVQILIESFMAMFVVIIIMAIMAIFVIRYIEGEQNKVYDLAYVDDLTRAPNENAFKERATQLLADNPDIPYMLVCFDIVNFRYINEGYGHLKADMLLRDIAVALRESYSFNETFGRLSADRFVGLCVDDERIVERKEFITERLAKSTEEIGMKYPIKFKTGIYYIRDKKESISDMIDKANLARKSVMSVSRTLEAEYHEQLMEETRKQERVESRMHEALKNGEFRPYLQPKWNMATDHISGAEALIRWVDSSGKITPPNEFIPVFERNGFIEQVDFFMLEEVCKYIRRMIDEGREVYPVSINQSRYLLYDPNYIMKVQEIMIKYRVPRGLIELEITETVFFTEKERMLEVMRNLKEFNMNLSIDDFGSGYSSLNLLRDIPFDVLKIDRGFLDESVQSESGKWILRKIVEMAEGLNLKVICEGVETHQQVEMLLDIGCIYAQGFLYSRPIPLEEFMEKFNLPVEEDSPVTFYMDD